MTVTVRPARANPQSFSALWRFEQGQERIMAMLVIDFVLFSCMAAFVTGIVIAVAKLIM
jgi:hypothetical protein